MRYRDMVTVGAYIPDQLLEQIETYRWGNRLSRSEFIRQSIEIHLELIRRARQDSRQQHRRHTN